MFACAMIAFCPTFAQGINDKADNIVGEYLTDRGGSKSKVRITKNAQGTYDAQVFWVEKPFDKDGKKRKDVKNPDKMPKLYNLRRETDPTERRVCDFISSMTDRYAIELHAELYIPKVWRGTHS